MMKTTSYFSLLFLLIIGCTPGTDRLVTQRLGDFGGFYTRINSENEFERFARVKEHADIVVDLGMDQSALVFWMGSSYLPFLETPSGRWYVEEIIPRSGDGTDMMPDRTNAYSVVKLIESNENQVVVHWRYLPEFVGGNPQLGVDATGFVDEYFYIQSDGAVKRTIKSGTTRIDEWQDKGNQITQTFRLTSSGIQEVNTQEPGITERQNKVEGSPLVNSSVLDPIAWWNFDEGNGNTVQESISKTGSEVQGNKTLWRKGVSGTAVQLDGYTSAIEIPSAEAPALSDQITLESWVAIGAYPWSYVPIIQQSTDEPEVLLAKKGAEAFLIGEDEREGMEEPDDSFDFVLQEEDDTGYFFGLDGYGKPTFKLRVAGKWEQLVAKEVLERRKWYHLVATYSKSSGLMKVYLNGQEIGVKTVGKGEIELASNSLKIGKGKNRRPIRPVRSNTFSDSYSFDGLIDEIKIYNVALNDEQVKTSFEAYSPDPVVDMDKRVLPSGENRKEFGAYYTHLKFYDVWDNLWRFSDHPDVVVEFDSNPSKFIFWRGVGYIPMMVNDKDQWYSNEFNETWNRSGGEGCQEPMSDKESYNNHARIIENTPARTVVHWRYPLIDVNHVMANFDEETGWCDWSDWYYYIYPDGIAVKTMHLWTHGERDHEWQESMAIFGPDQHPEQVINTKDALSMLNLEGTLVDYDWVNGPPDDVAEPEGQCIQYVNYTGEYKPVTIGDFEWSNVYGGELTEYAVFPTWNHWPVGQMPSDGRYATYPDRTAHSSLTHVPPSTYREEKGGPTPYYQKILLEGMLNQEPSELVPLARSWMNPASISGLQGAKGSYEKGQRAYILDKSSDVISFTLDASEDSPIVNLALVIKNWSPGQDARILVDNEEIANRSGIIRDVDGSYTLNSWIEVTSDDPVQLEITGNSSVTMK